MIALRASKALLVLLVALFCLLVGYNNIVDYGSNFEFTRHVLLMDTTFPGNRLMGRAISSPLLHHAAYWLIIAGELVTGALCLAGAIALLRQLRSAAAAFARAKTLAVCGLTLGLLVWFFGFMTVAGEWFLMWQSPQWNGVESAFRFIVCIGVVLIYVAQNENT
ncbi:DUF2165 family protein [Paracidovorax oryzae]|uniref:DUF2165 family protein n=1 Tax=Paracidovorax oryzae TaxID=862720 RepID=UPI0002D63D5E|nr:DUF2165 domain-containing protein [Paracidovorax oryzae]